MALPTLANNKKTEAEGFGAVSEQIAAAQIPTETDDEAFARLAALPRADYDRCREAKAAALGIDARFLEQSALRDFLDVNPEGQWLRQEHLGIQADRVSASLLRRSSRRL